MTVEKPQKYRERGNIEVQYFNIQARLKANGQKWYVPPEGKRIHNIQSAWLKLEKCEHSREVALKDELIRQERLEQLAKTFARKATLRESWLKDMEQNLDEKIVFNNAAETEVAVKKHEAISAEILARKGRFYALNSLATELVQGNYRTKEKVRQRDKDIMTRWKALLDKLEGRKATLSGFSDIMSMFREINPIQEELKAVQSKVLVENYGKHLQATQDMLEQHSLQEAQLHALAQRIKKLNRRSQAPNKQGSGSTSSLDTHLAALNSQLKKVQAMSDKRKQGLETAQQYYQFFQDMEEEALWVKERIKAVHSPNLGRDLDAALLLLKRHEALEAEMQGRWPRCEATCGKGQDLVSHGHEARLEIKSRIKILMEKWKQLQDGAAIRRTKLEDAIEAQQYYADANEAESWMNEKIRLVTSDDYGKDEAGAQALLLKHNYLDQDIRAFNVEIKRLEGLAVLMTKAADEHNISPDMFVPVEEVVDVPKKIEVEEMIERVVMQDVVETRKIPQVKAIYAYKGQGLNFSQSEVMILLKRTNNNWWQVRKADASEGFVPANYVKEFKPKLLQKVVRQSVRVAEKVKVIKTVRSKSNLHFDKANVETRQRGLTTQYSKLCTLSQARKKNLEDAFTFFRFYRECAEFEVCMKEKNLLTSLAANKGRLDNINALADSIIKDGSSQADEVKRRQLEINRKWEELNKLKLGASGIELFRVLQRKHAQLEDELVPMEEKMNKMDYPADSVRSSYPDEKGYLDQRQRKLHNLWKSLKDKVIQQKRDLDAAQDHQQFSDKAKDLLLWSIGVRVHLASAEMPHNIKSAKQMNKKHSELHDDIHAHKDKFVKAKALGQKILEKNPSAQDVRDKMNCLEEEENAIDKLWNQRQKYLKNAYNLQCFNKKADQLDAVTQGHDAFLAVGDTGSTVDDMEGLLQRHEDFYSKLQAQDDQIKALNDLADRLIAKGYTDTAYIDRRRKEVNAHQQKAKEKAEGQKEKLAASLALKEFKRDANEME